MKRYLLYPVLLLLAMPIAAQSFEYTAACPAPDLGLTPVPIVYGEVLIDGGVGVAGDVVGVFNAADQLLGRSLVYEETEMPSGRTFFAFLAPLRTEDTGMGCGVFTDGDVITVRLLSGGSDILLAGNSTFAGSIETDGFIDGPDMAVAMIDIFDFVSAALPVTLANFSATPNRDKVDLTWSTSSETENSYFEVQRSTTPNGGFQNIGKVLGNETTTEFNTYEFTDNNPAEGTNYYRLKQFDFDGTTNFSPIVVADIAVSAERSVAVYPNPIVAGGRVTVRLNGNWTAGGANLQLVDANGRKVADWNGLSNGSLNTELPVVKAGIYQLIATDGKERKATRVIVH